MIPNPRHVAIALLLGAAPAAHAAPGDAQAFAAENRAAMDAMMAGMAAPSSGDVDRDFATQMIAHHQGAIAMAQAELRHGTNEQLRRIAQGIVVEQQQEIAAMRLALGDPLPPDNASSTAPAASPGPHHPKDH